MSSTDFGQLKYLLTGYVSDAKCEEITEVCKYFRELERMCLLTPTNFGVLKKALGAIGRQDLVEKIEQKEQHFADLFRESNLPPKEYDAVCDVIIKAAGRLKALARSGHNTPEWHQDKSLALPSDIPGSLQSQSCNAQDVVVQLQETLQLNRSSLEEPEPDTKGWIRCLAREAKCSDRLDVVKHLREIAPAGTTGPLLNELLDVRNIPGQQRLDLAVHLCGGNEWKVIAERLGFNQAYIRCFDKRFPNPLEVVLSCCHSSVGELYDILVECELPVLADFL